MTEKSVFRETWSPEMTSQSFPVSCFCTLPEVKFDAFGTSIVFALLISTLGRFDRANKKVCHIHFKRLSQQNRHLQMATKLGNDK